MDFSGSTLLSSALMFSLSCVFVPLSAAPVGWFRASTHIVTVLLACCCAVLVGAFLFGNDQLTLSFLNTHAQEPALYRFVGCLGTYEGSLLFFTLLVSFYGSLFGCLSRVANVRVIVGTLKVQAMSTASFIILTFARNNPFRTVAESVSSPGYFSPLLEDPSMTFHPPLLYLGMTGLSLVFSITVASSLERVPISQWLDFVRPWLLLPWGLITLGIASGSWWAHYQLGWGGYWGWDPTENTSLMPWLLCCALFHLLLIVKKTRRCSLLSLLLALYLFPMVLLGTFLVRTGLLTSVHSFGDDGERTRALFVLLLFHASIACAALFGSFYKRRSLSWPGLKHPWRSILFLSAVALMLVCFLCVAAGTVYPVFIKGASVSESFYQATFVPIAIACVILLPLASLPLGGRHLLFGIFASALCFLVFLYPPESRPLLVGSGLFLTGWISAAALSDIFRPALSFNLGRSLAHLGLALVILGITALAGWKREVSVPTGPGQDFSFNGGTYHFESLREEHGPDFTALSATIRTDSGKLYRPQLRYFHASEQTVSWPALIVSGLSQTYVALRLGGGEVILCQLRYDPLVTCLWIGSVLMAMGAFWACWRGRPSA